MSGGDPPIIITGGSVTIEFDQSLLKANGNGKFNNANKKIKRIEVTGDSINIAEDIPNGRVTIKVYFGNP